MRFLKKKKIERIEQCPPDFSALLFFVTVQRYLIRG